MKRALLVSACAVAGGAGVFGLVKVLPDIRKAIVTHRHIGKAALREPAARHAWEREFGDPDRTLGRFPRSTDNQTAIRLSQLVRPFGIDMKRQGGDRAGALKVGADRALSEAVSGYGRAELTKAHGRVQPPPEILRAFLDGCRPEIDATVRFLSNSEALEWATDLSLGLEAPAPNLPAQMELQRILIADALNHDYLGQTTAAEETLDASWALNASLRNRPEVVSRLIAIAVARMQTGLVRRLSVDPVQWDERLVEHDYRASLARAFEVESIGAFKVLPTGTSDWERASRADFLDLRRSLLVRVRDSRLSDGPAEDLARPDRADESARSAGGIIHMISAPNLEMMPRRADRLIFDGELSQRILRARMLKARLGHWPVKVPELEGSRMPGGQWVYALEGGERMTIAFSRNLNWGEQKGLVLPARYESDNVR